MLTFGSTIFPVISIYAKSYFQVLFNIKAVSRL